MTFKQFIKTSQYGLEAIAFFAMVGIVKLLPHGLAAWLSGWIAWGIGRWTRGQTTALHNLNIAFPQMELSQKKALSQMIWRHLGAVFADSVHMNRIVRDIETYVTLIDGDKILEAKQAGVPIMLVTAHFGNWEVSGLVSNLTKIKPHYIYRAVNNPIIDAWVRKRRGLVAGVFAAKNNDTAKKIVKSYHQGLDIGLLADQKLNGGIPVPFFGKDCQTAVTPFLLAMRGNYKILLCQSLRINQGLWKPPHFELRVSELPYSDMDIQAKAKGEHGLAILIKLHHQFEAWIRANPEQWFWIHNRWGK